MSRTMTGKSVAHAQAAVARPLRSPASLHTLGAHLQVVQAEADAHRLLLGLEEALAATAAAAPVRHPFRFGRSSTPPTARAADWPHTLWSHYGPNGASQPTFVSWSRLLGVRPRRRVGGVSPAACFLGLQSLRRTPVLVHVTRLVRRASPLGAIVEAVAGAVVVRSTWTRGLRADWAAAVRGAGFGEPRLPAFLDEVSVCVAAPVDDWRALADWRHPDRARLSTVQLQTIRAFVDRLGKHGFRVEFSSLEDHRGARFLSGLDVTAYPLPRLGRREGAEV